MSKYIFNAALLLVCVSLTMLSCNTEKETNAAQENAQSATNTEQTPNHPARSAAEGMPFKITANGGPANEQIRQQEIANDRALRNKHLNTGGLEWTTFDHLAQNPPSDNKKYLIDVYTEWCGWCKVMDRKTFTDASIQNYLRENFHIVKFDAEQREPVSFKGQEFVWINGGKRGINRLALELLGNRMSYPTLVYLDENLNKITVSPGYKTPEQLIEELKAINDMKS